MDILHLYLCMLIELVYSRTVSALEIGIVAISMWYGEFDMNEGHRSRCLKLKCLVSEYNFGDIVMVGCTAIDGGQIGESCCVLNINAGTYPFYTMMMCERVLSH